MDTGLDISEVHSGERGILDNNPLGLPFEVKSENDKTYIVDSFKPTVESLRDVLDKLSKFDVLYKDPRFKSDVDFAKMLMDYSTVVLTLSSDGRDHGLVYFTSVAPGWQAYAHFFFWDLRTVGKQRVLLKICDWMFKEFNLHRVEIVLPRYAYAALNRLHKMGVRLEGVMREAIFYDEKYSDMMWFGILSDELDEVVIENARFERTAKEDDWFGLLSHDELLMSKIIGRR